MFIEEDLVLFHPSLPQQFIKYVFKHELDRGKLIPRAGSFVRYWLQYISQADLKIHRNRELIQL
jgi:hypothetical protein